MNIVELELSDLREMVEEMKTYPGAVRLAYWHLKRLRRLQRDMKPFFTNRINKEIDELVKLLHPIDLVDCPSCLGSGKKGWGWRKHTCETCGGYKMVERTPEAVRQLEQTWGGS